MKLGKFVNVNTRDKWPNEAQDFTPWLLAALRWRVGRRY